MVVAAGLLVIAAVVAGCEKPGASHTTSPSARALLGTTEGNVVFAPGDAAPEPASSPGWKFDVGNARFSELEDGAAAIQVVGQLSARPGATAEFWLERDGLAIARWKGGLTRTYNGSLCFQFRLEQAGQAVPLGEGSYALTFAFRDPISGQVVAAHEMHVAGRAPRLEGAPPTPASDVMRVLLGCPRSVI